MSTKPKDSTDLAAGLLLMAIAAFFGWQTLDLEIGTSLRMGPGYFPMVLSGLLFVLGALVTAGLGYGASSVPAAFTALR